jgi:hypothetical protein
MIVASSQPKGPIAEEEIARVFNDQVVAKLAKLARLPETTDLQQLGARFRASAAVFARNVRLPTANTVHRQMHCIAQAAMRQKYARLAEMLVARVPGDAWQSLDNRARTIRQRLPDADHSYWMVPQPEELLDPNRQRVAERIWRLAVVGGHWSPGRKRPGGKQSIEWHTHLHAPAASKSEPKREPETDLVMRLLLDVAVTGYTPPVAANYDRPGPFCRMVAEFLRLVRAPTTPEDFDCTTLAVRLLNNIASMRRRSSLKRKWRRILTPLRKEDDLVHELGRMVELGKAKVLRAPAGAGTCHHSEEPTIIEDPERGTLCFYLSPSQSKIIAVRPSPRARIMQIGEMLDSMNRMERSASERHRAAVRARRAARRSAGKGPAAKSCPQP